MELVVVVVFNVARNGRREKKNNEQAKSKTQTS